MFFKKVNPEQKWEKYIDKKLFKSPILSLYWIINSQFWKSILFPIFAFIFPIIFLSILGNLLGYYWMFGSVLTISSTAVGMVSLPMAIFEFKNSSILRRIGVTKINKNSFLLVILSYYALIMFLGTMFTFLVALLMFSSFWNEGKVIITSASTQKGIFIPNLSLVSHIRSDSFFNLIKQINWIALFLGIILNILISGSLGLLIASIAKSAIAVQGIGIPILIISMFLAAQALPLNMTADLRPFWYIGYLSPFKSSSLIIIKSVNGIVDSNWQNTNNDLYVEELVKYINGETFSKILQNRGMTNSEIQALITKLGTDLNLTSTAKIIQVEKLADWIFDFNKIVTESLQESQFKIVADNIKQNAIAASTNSTPIPLPTTITKPEPIDYSVAPVNITLYNNMIISEKSDLFGSYKIVDRALNSELITVVDEKESYATWIIPFVWIILFFGIASRRFKWATR